MKCPTYYNDMEDQEMSTEIVRLRRELAAAKERIVKLTDEVQLRAESYHHWRHHFERAEKAEAALRDLKEQIVKLNEFVDWVKNAQVDSGVCCCGDPVAGHLLDSHSPVDMWHYGLDQWVSELDSIKEAKR